MGLLDSYSQEAFSVKLKYLIPVVALLLHPAILLSQNVGVRGVSMSQELAFELKEDRLAVTSSGKPVAEFVFGDQRIRRPYFANLFAPGGIKVTRNHPPLEGTDPHDHAEMHPGLWLGFGDINGSDFWRNKGSIEHRRFSEEPAIHEGRLTFVTECRLLTEDKQPLCMLTNRVRVSPQPGGWLIVWKAVFRSDDRDFSFGDQEEMGFGARVATSLTEKNGGTVLNSGGLKSADRTWGQPADWCDYAGAIDGRRYGITLMASPDNFRKSWWHNRDYGVFVANPFGRQAMKQGEKSTVTVKRGEDFAIEFGARIYEGEKYDPAQEYESFLEILK